MYQRVVYNKFQTEIRMKISINKYIVSKHLTKKSHGFSSQGGQCSRESNQVKNKPIINTIH